MTKGNVFFPRAGFAFVAALLAGALLDGPPGAHAETQGPLSERSPPPMLADTGSTSAGSEARTQDLRNQAMAMLGREDRIVRDDPPTCILADANPLDMIADAARETSVVIINEAPDMPRHRAFIADVAARLLPLGYKTYAAETLTPPIEFGPGAPKLRAGYYSAEPTFGALLRQLRAADVRLVAYDQNVPSSGDYADDINRRESLAVSNLVNRAFMPNRGEKVLIHVTYAHNKETPEGVGRGVLKSRQILWLGQRLKEILGVDPLTIDQTTYGAERLGACFTETSGAAPPQGRDLYIAHPAADFENHRPAWRRERGQAFVETPKSLRRPDKRVVVEARPTDEYDDTVPLDRILVEPGETIPLLLPPGQYKARAWIDGKWTQDTPVNASAPARSPAQTKKPKRKSP